MIQHFNFQHRTLKKEVEPAHEILVLIALSSNKCTGEPAQIDSPESLLAMYTHYDFRLMMTLTKI